MGQAQPNSWLPEAFGLRIGDPPDAMMLEIPLDRVEEALDAIEQAVREERATFTFDTQDVPATEQSQAASSDLKGLIDASRSSTDDETASLDVLDRVHTAGEKASVFCESLAMQALLAVEFRRRYRLSHDVDRIHGGVAGDALHAAVEASSAVPAASTP